MSAAEFFRRYNAVRATNAGPAVNDNDIRTRARRTLKLWAIPQIQGRDVDELLANLSEEYVRLHRSALRSANAAIVITAIAVGNGMQIKD